MSVRRTSACCQAGGGACGRAINTNQHLHAVRLEVGLVFVQHTAQTLKHVPSCHFADSIAGAGSFMLLHADAAC